MPSNYFKEEKLLFDLSGSSILRYSLHPDFGRKNLLGDVKLNI